MRERVVAWILIWAMVLLRLPGQEFWHRADRAVDRLLGQREFDGVYVGQRGPVALPGTPSEAAVNGNVAAVNAFANANPASRVYLALVPHRAQREGLPETLTVAMEQIPGRLENVTWLVLEPGEDGYFATDSHWNSLGASRGWQQLREAMGLEPGAGYDGYTASSGVCGALGDWGFRDEVELLLPKTGVALVGRENLYDDCLSDPFGVFPNRGTAFATTAGTGRSLLILGDEWGGALVPLVYPWFDRVCYALSPPEEGFSHVLFLYGAENFLTD